MLKKLFISLLLSLVVVGGAIDAIETLINLKNSPLRTITTNLQCGATSRLKTTKIVNPSVMKTDCEYIIRAYNSKVCQLRIDFDIILAQPQIDGYGKNYPHCMLDIFSVNDIEICGTNLNQHIYVPFDVQRLTDTISLRFKIADRLKNPMLSAVLWTMTVTQVECSEKALLSTYDSLQAPAGCLQYFTDKMGNIESFNYNHALGPYLGDMNYAICIKRRAEDKNLSIKPATFGLSKSNPNNDGYDQDCYPQIKTIGSNEDYVFIPDAILYYHNGTEIRATKFCGNSLDSGSIISAPPGGPFVLNVNSDRHYDGNTERGFRFIYSIDNVQIF